MPTYEYECKACQHKFEKFQSITANPTRKCPECKANKVKRLIGMGAGVIFKGSGFYQTDYRSSAYNDAAKKDKEPTADCGTSEACKSCEHSKDASKTDSKKVDTPAAKKDAKKNS